MVPDILYVVLLPYLVHDDQFQHPIIRFYQENRALAVCPSPFPSDVVVDQLDPERSYFLD